MTIKRMDLSWIMVSDLQKAKDFYVNTLGLEVNEYSEKYHWLEVIGEDGGMILGIGQAQTDGCDSGAGKPGSNAVVTCVVENLEKAIQHYSAQGVTFVGKVIEIPHQVKMISFTDPDGNMFQLVERLNERYSKSLL